LPEAIDGYCVMQILFDHDGSPHDYRFLEANAAFDHHTGLRMRSAEPRAS